MNSLPQGYTLDTNIEPPSGYVLDRNVIPPDGYELDNDIQSAGVGIFPSMPEKRPAVIPKPKEQLKVHGMVDSLPKEISVEVKRKRRYKNNGKRNTE
jgi:hypothetical protein